MDLHCPHCRAPLQSYFYEGIGTHLCTGCRGVLLGKDELQQIAHKREKQVPRNTPTPRRGYESEVQCPRCRVPMKKGKYGKLRATTFDLCEQCSSVWLDRGELESIQLDFEMVSDNLGKSRQQAPAAAIPASAAQGTIAQPSGTAAAAFHCPKCNHPQPQGSVCVRCGIVFAKYETLQRELAAHDAHAARLTERVEEAIGSVSGFEVQQQYHMTEVLVGFERANRYTLRPIGGTRGAIWHVEESNRSGLSILGRNLFGALYTFAMNVLDESGNCILKLQRQARFYFYHLDVYGETGRMVGSVRRRFSFFNRVLTVHDDGDRELLRIVGPFYSPWTFVCRQRGVDAGSIVKKWSGLLKESYTDADRFSIRFGAGLDTRVRRLVLGATVLIDSLYFEGRRPFVSHYVSAPGVQILAVLLIVGTLTAGELTIPVPMETPPPAVERDGAAIWRHEFPDLLERRQSLATLAVAGQYTVVEVYLDSCAICRQLESGFGRFTQKRPDVTIQRVHVPQNGIQFSLSGTTQQEVEEQAQAVQALMKPVCGTPHVEIYGPDRRPLARDMCGDKSGTKYLRRWIAAETGLSVRDLLTGAGANASTPMPGMN